MCVPQHHVNMNRIPGHPAFAHVTHLWKQQGFVFFAVVSKLAHGVEVWLFLIIAIGHTWKGLRSVPRLGLLMVLLWQTSSTQTAC